MPGNIFYIIGVIVVVLFILGYLGLRWRFSRCFVWACTFHRILLSRFCVDCRWATSLANPPGSAAFLHPSIVLNGSPPGIVCPPSFANLLVVAAGAHRHRGTCRSCRPKIFLV